MRPEGFTSVSDILRSGVYALVYRREVVYVGQSKNMLVRIYSHRNAWGDKRRGANRQMPSWCPVKGILFDEIFVLPCATDKLNDLEREMIARYRPWHNIKLVPKVGTLSGMVINGVTIGGAQRPLQLERRV